MKIGILTFPMNKASGLGRCVHELTVALSKRGHEVVVLELHGSWWGYAGQIWRFAKTADVVYALDINPFGFIGFFATRFTGATFIIIALATYSVAPLYNWKQSFITRLIFQNCDAVIAVSSYTASEILKQVSVPSLRVIHLGVDPKRFSNIASAPSEPPYIIGVGAIKPRKGYDVSIRAFAQVAKKYPTLRYKIIGSHTQDPAYVTSLQTLVRELGIEGVVEFPERVSDDDLLRMYAGASLFILTSVNDGHHFEGFGLVFLEAAACGLPTIGTKDNGIADAILDGKTGLLVPQHDSVATAAALETLLSDGALRARMSDAARKSIEARTWEHIAEQYDEVYKGTLKNKL